MLNINAMMRHAPAITLVAGALVVMTVAAHAAAFENPCRAAIGFDTSTGGTVLGGGAWEVVGANRDSFLGRKSVADCEVKIVVSTVKGKPGVSAYFAGPMTQNECSLYNYLASVDSKMSQGKTADALSTINSMISKVDGLNATGKLEDAGYVAIRDAADAVQQCIALLP